MTNRLLVGALCIICIMLAGQISAQVTIGSGAQPSIGTLLDLKEYDSPSGGVTATKGLLLPKVMLQTLDKLQPKNALYTGDDVHIGLTVYNLEDKKTIGLCPGVYAWSGSLWMRISNKSCDCEYSITGSDAIVYNIYCSDFQDTIDKAADVCASQAINPNKTYHVLTSQEFEQLWNKSSADGTQKFDDGEYAISHNGWMTVGTIASGSMQILGAGYAFPAGMPIGGLRDATGNKIIRCVRD